METTTTIYLAGVVITIALILFLARRYKATGGNGILVFLGGVVWPLTWLIFAFLVIGRGLEKLIDSGEATQLPTSAQAEETRDE